MLVAYEVALELAAELKPIIPAIRKHSAEAADQIERAAISVVLNVAEGAHRSGRDRNRLFVYARGSAGEIKAVLDLAGVWGWSIEVSAARKVLGRLLALLWGLTREASLAPRAGP